MMQRSPTCGKCLKNYEFKDFRPVGSHIPLLLSCGHSFCEGCLLILSRQRKEINCPTCEIVTVLKPEGEKGVKSLLPDIYLLGVLAYNKRVILESGNINGIHSPCWNFGYIHPLALPKVEPLEDQTIKCDHDSSKAVQDEATSLAHVLCEGCSKRATCICKSCEDCTFCESCFISHHKALKRLQKHTPMPLSIPRNKEMECSEHGGRLLEFFDKDLEIPICALCIIAEKHKGHEVLPISDLGSELNESLEKSLNTAREISNLLKMSEKMIGRAIPDLTIMANIFLHDVKSFFNKMHASLQIREATILSEASELFAKNFSLTSQIAYCIRKQRSIEAVIKEYEALSQQPQFLRIKIKEILAKLEEVKNMECYAEISAKNEERLRFVADEVNAEQLKNIGALEINGGALFKMLKLEDVSEEIRGIASGRQLINGASVNHFSQDAVIADDDFVTMAVKEHFSNNNLVSSEISVSYELVYVTFVRTPENFFVQRCSDKDRLHHMMCNLNKYCNTSDQASDLVFCPEKDDVVCAQFLADNHWYRARIKSVNSSQQPNVIPTWENGLPVEVHYIDYGNTECLPLSRLRKMKAQFLQVPELAVPCSLVDIVPPNKQTYWPVNSIKAFNSLVGDKPMLMNIRSRFDGRLYVDLRRPDDPERLARNDERPVSVRDALVFLDVARFSTAKSIPIDWPTPLSTFKDPVLPQPDEQTDVIITHVVSPHEIYAQKLGSPISKIHEELAALFSSRKRCDGATIPFPYRNMICAARFSEDKLWYRGLVTHRYDDCTIDVKFVDYGNSEKTSMAEIRKLPGPCLNLPMQAIPVRLKDINIPENQDNWTEEAINFLKITILNKPIVMISKAIEDGVVLAELCDTSTDEDIYINNLLVERGFANDTGLSNSMESPCQQSLDTLSIHTTEASIDSNTLFDDDNSETASCSAKSEPVSKLPMYGTPIKPPGSTFKVMGTFIDDNGIIFGHLLEGEAKELEAISSTLNDGAIAKMPSLQNSDILSRSQACVARFSMDELWYRSSVVQVVDAEHVEVEFVDFGNREIVHTDYIRNITPFLDTPRQAVKLKLHGIEPLDEDGIYPPAAIEALSSLMINETFTVCLEGRQLDPNVLDVTIMVQDNDNLGESLIVAGFARRTTSAGSHENQPELEILQMRRMSLADDYKAPTLPDIGVHFDVHVTQVEKPNMVFIQRLFHSDEDDNDGGGGSNTPLANDDDETEIIMREEHEEYQRLAMLINSEGFFDDSSHLDSIEPGMLCCAQYSLDDEWYRGKIKAIRTPENVATNEVTGADVLFVDYGTFETVPLERLKKIPSNFIDVPVQAIGCELAGFFPPEIVVGKLYRDTRWPVETMKSLYNLVADKRLIASILDYGPPVKIVLLDRIQVSDDETGERTDKAIAKMLAEMNLGVYDLTRVESTPSELSIASST